MPRLIWAVGSHQDSQFIQIHFYSSKSLITLIMTFTISFHGSDHAAQIGINQGPIALQFNTLAGMYLVSKVGRGPPVPISHQMKILWTDYALPTRPSSTPIRISTSANVSLAPELSFSARFKNGLYHQMENVCFGSVG